MIMHEFEDLKSTKMDVAGNVKVYHQTLLNTINQKRDSSEQNNSAVCASFLQIVDNSNMVYDVAIIGSGPCGLAVAARLREETPSALFTDDEHSRYWRKFNRRETIENERKLHQKVTSSDGIDKSTTTRSIIVLDALSDKWMSSWGEKFRKLQINHLRSPLFFHPDPRDRDSLLAFSHLHSRTTELQEIPNVAGKELSKHRLKKRRQR